MNKKILMAISFYFISVLALSQDYNKEYKFISFRPKKISVSLEYPCHLWNKSNNFIHIENNLNLGFDSRILLFKASVLRFDIHCGSYTKNLDKNTILTDTFNSRILDPNIINRAKYIGFGLGLFTPIKLNQRFSIEPEIIFSIAQTISYSKWYKIQTTQPLKIVYYDELELTKKNLHLLQFSTLVNYSISDRFAIGVLLKSTNEIELLRILKKLQKTDSTYMNTPFLYLQERPLTSLSFGLHFTYSFPLKKREKN